MSPEPTCQSRKPEPKAAQAQSEGQATHVSHLDRNPYVRLRITEEPSPRSGRWIVAHGASRGNAARIPGSSGKGEGEWKQPSMFCKIDYQPCRFGHPKGDKDQKPAGLSETSRFSFSSSRQAATGKRLKRPCRGWKSFGHTYPRLAPWATFKRPLRGLGSSVADKLTDGLGPETTREHLGEGVVQ